MQGDLRLHDPGEKVPALLKADGTGTVAERGDPIETVDETGGVTRVQLAQNPDSAVGNLRREPEVYDDAEDYANDEEIGRVTVILDGPVDWYDEAAAATDPTPGDEVVLGSGGVREANQVADADTDTQSGDGATTTFNIAHGLDVVPEIRNVWPESEGAAGDFWVSNVDDTNIEITYAGAPADGNDNLTWGYEVHETASTRPYGTVWATGTRASGMTHDKVAVIRER